MKITNEKGDQILPTNTVGEIWTKSCAVSKGYWGNEKATKEVFVDGWYKTGDVGKLDEEGYLYL